MHYYATKKWNKYRQFMQRCVSTPPYPPKNKAISFALMEDWKHTGTATSHFHAAC